jgi:hypothetical protein
MDKFNQALSLVVKNKINDFLAHVHNENQLDVEAFKPLVDVYVQNWLKTELKTKKVKRPVDPNAPKKPLSAYLQYSQSVRAAVKADNPDADNNEILKLIGARWKVEGEQWKKDHGFDAAKPAAGAAVKAEAPKEVKEKKKPAKSEAAPVAPAPTPAPKEKEPKEKKKAEKKPAKKTLLESESESDE